MKIQKTNAANDSVPVALIPQTGMPQIYAHRSKELIYDTLQDDARFAQNPFGPQLLILSRSNHRW